MAPVTIVKLFRSARGFKRPYALYLAIVLVAVVFAAGFLLIVEQQKSNLVASSGDRPAPVLTPALPPSGGYFQLQPVGSFPSLPSDSQAAAMVRRSSWEPRPENSNANHTVPPTSFKQLGYSGMEHRSEVFGRITGNFRGTTDEIIQWAAAKWGLPDEVIRAEAAAESRWYQGLKDASGKPVNRRGYGDFGDCGGSPALSGYGANGPSSFGLMQVKWCSLKDASSPGYDGWPWTEYSTAYAVDTYAAVIRGCYEGWDSWMGNGYQSGDLWGCVGRWYAGAWYDTEGDDYIARVKKLFNDKPWLQWPGR